ncbi:MAG: formate dehydrogenase accessory protein FdhE [Candidatus Eremiobacteraeota bacterium]|nr:formate dehydrogenase accessory protein FdhE [Candidatus Eremiobacteraeota bacterium]
MALAFERPTTERWAERRRRAVDLAERWSFAAEVLTFYAKVSEVEEAAYAAALESPVESVAAFAGERILPRLIEVAVADGPAPLSSAVLQAFDRDDFAEIFAGWLRDEPLDAIARFVARACCGPVLEALAESRHDLPRLQKHDDCCCPNCGGLPQLSFFASSPEDLVTPHRYLECSRCATAWGFPRMTCAGCGETDSAKLLVLGEVGTAQGERSASIVKSQREQSAPGPTPPPTYFPHMRIDGCTSCKRYLLTVDLERDGRAVPVVDEIAALPLTLYAQERGLTKIVPNLMGF